MPQLAYATQNQDILGVPLLYIKDVRVHNLENRIGGRIIESHAVKRVSDSQVLNDISHLLDAGSIIAIGDNRIAKKQWRGIANHYVIREDITYQVRELLEDGWLKGYLAHLQGLSSRMIPGSGLLPEGAKTNPFPIHSDSKKDDLKSRYTLGFSSKPKDGQDDVADLDLFLDGQYVASLATITAHRLDL